jgi:predicted ATP-grasp superfamily ATP-dependent carboligase
VIIYAYSNKSKSARKLAKVLGCKLLRAVKSKYKGGKIINWGNAKAPAVKGAYEILNEPQAVNIAIDKLRTFKALHEAKVPTVPFTTNKEVAKDWLLKNKTVFARETQGHSGSGITIVSPDGDLPDSPVFTQYVKKKREFRVHIFAGIVVDVAQKRKIKGFENPNTFIRSHKNGWVFCREDLVEPDDLREVSIAAVKTLGLDFGAVDVIWNEKQNKCFVLEVNTAPGLEGTTLERYADAIQTW